METGCGPHARHRHGKTVETYKARLMEKLGLRSRAALVRFALETGILEKR